MASRRDVVCDRFKIRLVRTRHVSDRRGDDSTDAQADDTDTETNDETTDAQTNDETTDAETDDETTDAETDDDVAHRQSDRVHTSLSFRGGGKEVPGSSIQRVSETIRIVRVVRHQVQTRKRQRSVLELQVLRALLHEEPNAFPFSTTMSGEAQSRRVSNAL